MTREQINKLEELLQIAIIEQDELIDKANMLGYKTLAQVHQQISNSLEESFKIILKFLFTK